MWPHPHNWVKMWLFVDVERPRGGGELRVFIELASLPQVPFDLTVAAAAPLPLPCLTTVNSPVPVNQKQKLLLFLLSLLLNSKWFSQSKLLLITPFLVCFGIDSVFSRIIIVLLLRGELIVQ